MSISEISSTLPLNKPVQVINEERATVYHGNCLDALKVEPRSSVSLIVTSPPYPGVDQPEPDYVTFPDPKNFTDAHDHLEKVWRVCYDLLEDLGRLAINLYDIPTGAEGMYPNVAVTISRCLRIGFVLRETIIWDKGAGYSPPSGSWPYPKGLLTANTYEPVLVFQKPLQFSQRRKDPSDYPKEIRDKSQLGAVEHEWLMNPVWKISADREGRALGHPFTFATELVERLIKLYTFYGDTILDPFLGSGTTVKVASTLGRNGVGFELSEKYINICKNRLAQGSLF